MSNTLTAETRKTIVENISGLLEENYAFPEAVPKMAAYIREKLEQGSYDGIVDASEFSRMLTVDLQNVSQDLHLGVLYRPEMAAELAKHEQAQDADEDTQAQLWAQCGSDNYGFKRVEHLPGNIGYVDIRQFAPVSQGGEKAVAVMGFVADSDALIFDLRQNGGGDPFMVQLIESYLFAGEPKLLLTMYERPLDRHQQIWTLSHVPGKRLPNVPVYILTSGSTFSGGEDFAYTLKHLGRATVVGEVTGGGGHVVDFKVVHEGFIISLPTGYPTHPVTKSNWEGTGVEPDISVPRKDALRTTHIHALESLIEKSQDGEQIRRLRWELERVKITYAPPTVPEAILSRYVGKYGNWVVALRDGVLFTSRENRRDDLELIPMSETSFIVDDEYNIRFVVAEQDTVSALVFVGRDREQEITITRAGE